MSLSLREQLLAAGLGTKKQAKHIEQQQRQENRHKPKSAPTAQEKRAAAHAQAQAAKAARDQELNRKRREEAQQRERWAQVKQLVEQNVIARAGCEEGFNFIDRGKVRRILVNADLRERVISGSVSIVRSEGRYHLVPAEIGARIGEREPRALVLLSQNLEKPSEPAENDPYKDFVVPDDLKW